MTAVTGWLEGLPARAIGAACAVVVVVAVAVLAATGRFDGPPASPAPSPRLAAVLSAGIAVAWCDEALHTTAAGEPGWRDPREDRTLWCGPPEGLLPVVSWARFDSHRDLERSLRATPLEHGLVCETRTEVFNLLLNAPTRNRAFCRRVGASGPPVRVRHS